MKKFSFVLMAAMLCLLGQAQAYSWGDLRDDVYDHTRVTVLKSAVPSYFYNMRKGQSEGGVETSIVTYRFISADTGYTTPYDAGKKGTIILGGSLHIDTLISESFPLISRVSPLLVLPSSALAFWDRLTIGFYCGHNLDDNDLDYGIRSGLEFKF